MYNNALLGAGDAMSLRKAAEMALEALEEQWEEHEAIDALRQALAQPEQKPYAWMTTESEWRLANGGNCKGAVPVHGKRSRISTIPLYTAPPKREWVGLTDEEVESWRGNYDFFNSALVREVEAKLKEKNI